MQIEVLLIILVIHFAWEQIRRNAKQKMVTILCRKKCTWQRRESALRRRSNQENQYAALLPNYGESHGGRTRTSVDNRAPKISRRKNRWITSQVIMVVNGITFMEMLFSFFFFSSPLLSWLRCVIFGRWIFFRENQNFNKYLSYS